MKTRQYDVVGVVGKHAHIIPKSPKMMVAFATALGGLIFILSSSSGAFVPLKSVGAYRDLKLQAGPQISSSTVDSVKSAAEDALTKLLKRQQDEVAETQRLLKQIQDLDYQGTASSSSASEVAPEAIAILAGVDYGFGSRSQGCACEDPLNTTTMNANSGGTPGNLWKLGSQQFMRNLRAIRGEYSDEENTNLNEYQKTLEKRLEGLSLNTTALWEREFADGGPTDAPWLILVPYFGLCYMLDIVFEGRYIPSRFFLLETVNPNLQPICPTH